MLVPNLDQPFRTELTESVPVLLGRVELHHEVGTPEHSSAERALRAGLHDGISCRVRVPGLRHHTVVADAAEFSPFGLADQLLEAHIACPPIGSAGKDHGNQQRSDARIHPIEIEIRPFLLPVVLLLFHTVFQPRTIHFCSNRIGKNTHGP